MISELKDDEILDFLMTSDFEGDYKPDELKYLLFKSRYFYRLLHGRHENIKGDNIVKIKELEDECKSKDIQYENVLVENAELKNQIDGLKNRKLTMKERFSGKIITKQDENR